MKQTNNLIQLRNELHFQLSVSILIRKDKWDIRHETFFAEDTNNWPANRFKRNYCYVRDRWSQWSAHRWRDWRTVRRWKTLYSHCGHLRHNQSGWCLHLHNGIIYPNLLNGMTVVATMMDSAHHRERRHFRRVLQWQRGCSIRKDRSRWQRY